MARYKHASRKKHLARQARTTRWAPIWAVLRVYGTAKGRRTHPARLTKHKRSWRRTKMRV